MNVKALDGDHLLVILTAQEAAALGFDCTALRKHPLASRLTIARLFVLACERAHFSLCRSAAEFFERVAKVGLHAMRTVEGQWVLVFRAYPNASGKAARRTYRVKTPGGPYCYRMACCGALLNALERFCAAGLDCACQIVSCQQGFFLIVSPKCRDFAAVQGLAGEYGRLWGKGRAARAFLLEHGRLLASDAISRVGGCLLKRRKEQTRRR